MTTTTDRPLTGDERRQLTARLSGARAESRLALIKTGGAGAIVCGPLALVTLAVSDAPRIVVVVFWTVTWLALTLWIGLPWRRLMRAQIPALADALRANRAREIRLQSSRVVEFEEEEDEGACYAFAHEPGASIFIVGQEFYEDDDFPNTDFSMIELLGSHGGPVEVLLTKRGRRLRPERVIPAAVKIGLDLPEHLEVVPARLEDLESALGGRA